MTSQFTLIVKATEDCQQIPPEEPFFKPDDDTLLKVWGGSCPGGFDVIVIAKVI